MVFRVRARRGRVVSAGSAYHAVHRADVGLPRRAQGRAGRRRRRWPPPPSTSRRWPPPRPRPGCRSSSARPASWRLRAGGRRRASTRTPSRPRTRTRSRAPAERRRHVVLSAADEALAARPAGHRPGRRRRAAARRPRARRRAARRQPAAPPVLEPAADGREPPPRPSSEIAEIDEDRVLLDSAVKGADGFFTTFFVSPYSKYIARWAARRGLTPNQVTTASVFIGLLAAIAFATGERWGMVDRRRAAPALVHHRLRRRPARPLHAAVLQARRVAGLGLRPHEGVPRVRRAGDRREPDGRPRVAAGLRGDHAQTVRHMSDFSFGGAQQLAIGSTVQPPVEQSLDAAGAAAEARRAAAGPRARARAGRAPARRGGPPARRVAAAEPGPRVLLAEEDRSRSRSASASRRSRSPRRCSRRGPRSSCCSCASAWPPCTRRPAAS